MLLETLEYLGIAFICSVLLIIMSKIILQALIRRPADYYNAEELRQEELMLNAGGISITLEHDTNPEGEIMSETHLEARLGDIEPAEPEEIIDEIPQSVHDSIEVSEEPDDDEPDDGIEYVDYPEDEDYPAAEPEKAADVPENVVSSEPEEVIAEEPEEVVPEEPEVTAGEPEEIIPAEPEKIISGEPEEQFGFSIKAKTSRTKKPKNREEEAAAEELEQAKAAMDEAKNSENGEAPASSWTESYADIRTSLEHAFTENNQEDKQADDAASDKPADDIASDKPDEGQDEAKAQKPSRKKNSGRRRAPSMNMNKKELLQIAASRGIEVPEEATKRQILDLIYSDRRKRY